jgi:hypothetical protein
MVRSVRSFDRWVLWCTALLTIAYFAYWHDGYYLGPRFFYPMAPWLAWWSARLPAVLRDRQAPVPLQRFVVVGGAAAMAIGALQLVPIRARQYQLGMQTMRLDIAEVVRETGVRDATILVRESWGAQMVARLWALGVTRPVADMYYRSTDACVLETAITAVEREGGNADDLVARLAASRADVHRLVALYGSADTTLRVLSGSRYSARCLRRLKELQAGRTIWPVALLVEDDNHWIRDLHERSAPGIDTTRAVWLLTRQPIEGDPIVFSRVNLDSMRAEWSLP